MLGFLLVRTCGASLTAWRISPVWSMNPRLSSGPFLTWIRSREITADAVPPLAIMGNLASVFLLSQEIDREVNFFKQASMFGLPMTN